MKSLWSWALRVSNTYLSSWLNTLYPSAQMSSELLVIVAYLSQLQGERYTTTPWVDGSSALPGMSTDPGLLMKAEEVIRLLIFSHILTKDFRWARGAEMSNQLAYL